jgi:hypothetical protein
VLDRLCGVEVEIDFCEVLPFLPGLHDVVPVKFVPSGDRAFAVDSDPLNAKIIAAGLNYQTDGVQPMREFAGSSHLIGASDTV